MKSLIYLCVLTLLLVSQVSAQISEADAIKQLAEIDNKITSFNKREGSSIVTYTIHDVTCKVVAIKDPKLAVIMPEGTSVAYLLMHDIEDLERHDKRRVRYVITDHKEKPWDLFDEKVKVVFALTAEHEKLLAEHSKLRSDGFDMASAIALYKHGKPFSLYINQNGKTKKAHKYKVKNVMPMRNTTTGKFVAMLEDTKGKQFQAPGNLAERSQKSITPFVEEMKLIDGKYLKSIVIPGDVRIKQHQQEGN